jgi:monoamine oxidase
MTRRAFVASTAATGLAAAAACSGESGPRVIVVGAGMAGLGAADELRRAGVRPIVLEARGRIGGRVHTVEDLGAPIDLGAAWIHNSRGNPLTAVARRARLQTVPTDYDAVALRDAEGAAVPSAQLEAAAGAQERIDERLERAAEDADADDALGPALRRARAAADVPAAAGPALDWLLGNAIPLELAADVGELSVLGYDEGETYDGGDDLLLRKGAGALAAALGRGIDVRVNTPVREVRRRDDGVTVVTATGERIAADGCIVTVPLGVLKAGGVKFDPPLPAPARQAITRVGFGLLDKVILRYETPWWDAGTTLGVVGAPIGETVSAFDVSLVTGWPILVAFTGAAYARRLERRDDREVVQAVAGRLADGFGAAAAAPDGVLVTRWAADRWARGSYSFLPPGASPDDRAALGARRGRLMLAGEHTSLERPATMDGALVSGRRAGRELARVIGA